MVASIFATLSSPVYLHKRRLISQWAADISAYLIGRCGILELAE